MRKRDWPFTLAACAIALILAGLTLTLVACASARLPAAPLVTAPATPARPPGGGLADVVPAWATPAVLAAIDRAKAADALAASLRGQLARAESDAKADHAEADEVKRQARLAPVYATLLWATWAAAGVALLGVALAVFMQRPGLLWITAAAAAVGIVAQATTWALDHPVAVGLTVAALGAICAVVALLSHRTKAKALEAAVAVGEYLKPKAEDAAAALVRKADQADIVTRAGASAAAEIQRVRKRLGHL